MAATLEKTNKDSSSEFDTNSSELNPSKLQQEQNHQLPNDDPDHEVFEVKEGGPNYRGVSWPRAAVLFAKTQIGIGVLNIPAAFNTLGMFTGIFTFWIIFGLATYGAYVMGQFRIRHRNVHSVADIGYIIGGNFGREFVGIAFILYTTLTAGSGMLGLSIAFNAVSTHGTCTMVFVAVAAIATIIFASFRTLTEVSWLGWIGLVSIVSGILVTVVGVGVSDRPAAAPATGFFDKHIVAVNDPTFEEAYLALVNVIFAFCSIPAYLPVISEMRNPEEYNKALFSAHFFIGSFNFVVGTVVYYYCGQYVSSPALGSAGPLLKKISYGLAIPALLVSCTIFTHVSAKYMFVRTLRGTRHLQENTFVHWFTWLGFVTGCAIFSFIIASAIPFFDSLVGLVGALFGTFLCMTLLGIAFFFDRWNQLFPKVDEQGNQIVQEKGVVPTHHSDLKPFIRGRSFGKWTPKKTIIVILNSLLIIIGTLSLVAGTYASAYSIKQSYDEGTVGSAFSCDDNSNSV